MCTKFGALVLYVTILPKIRPKVPDYWYFSKVGTLKNKILAQIQMFHSAYKLNQHALQRG